jgi:hypothetical protein
MMEVRQMQRCQAGGHVLIKWEKFFFFEPHSPPPPRLVQLEPIVGDESPVPVLNAHTAEDIHNQRWAERGPRMGRRPWSFPFQLGQIPDFPLQQSVRQPCPYAPHTLSHVWSLTWLLCKGLFRKHVLGRVDTGDESP